MDILGMRALREVEGLEKYTSYFVDVSGDVWSTQCKRLRKLSPGKSRKQAPYLFVYLINEEGEKRKWWVHHLVAMAFLGAPKEGEEINHINRNGLDNRLSNLEWCSRGDNMAHCTTTKGASLDSVVKEKAKSLHAKLNRMGYNLPDLHSFVNAILEGELDRLDREFTGKN